MGSEIPNRIWGIYLDDTLHNILHRLDSSQSVETDDARKVLTAVVDSEIREAIDTIETQMQEGKQKAGYERNSPESLFYHGHFFGRGYFRALVNALENVHPEYKLSKPLSVGTLVFKKVK